MSVRAWQFRRFGPGGSGTPGFTLVEILLALALLVLFATLLLPGVNSILRSLTVQEPIQLVAAQILEARQQALETGRMMDWRYDVESRRFRLDGEWQEPLPDALEVRLLPPGSESTVLLGGQLVATGWLRRVRFYPDGTCDPFEIQLLEPAMPPRWLRVDPWTCALMPVPKP